MGAILANKVVVVTGGARGIGRAIALACAQNGARAVMVGDLRPPPEGDAWAQYRSPPLATAGTPCQMRFVQCDVSNRSDVETLVASAAEFGGVDLMVCNAGIAVPDDGPELSQEHYRSLVGVNLDGVFFCAQHAARQMRARSAGGAIVFISSMGGLRGSGATVVYSATKGAVISLAKSLADALGPQGIRVNAVCPGLIDTDLVRSSPSVQAAVPLMTARTPLRRIGQPHEVAEAVVWLGSSLASFVSGATLAVDGGLSAVL